MSQPNANRLFINADTAVLPEPIKGSNIKSLALLHDFTILSITSSGN